MSGDKLQKALKYSEDLKNRISGSIPEKHKEHPASYKQFLERELKAVASKIDGLKLLNSDKK